jgi:RimJ/RimL family protein N-acetyltransferase
MIKTLGKKNDYIKSDIVEIGLFIDKDLAGKGFGSEAVNTMVNFSKNNSQLKKIKWCSDADNLASIKLATIKLATNCNFTYVEPNMFYEEKNGIVHNYDLKSIKQS